MTRSTLLLLVLIGISSCEKGPEIDRAEIYTTGPVQGSDGEVSSNVITFHYEAENPEPVYLVVDGKRLKTVMITGKIKWRIEQNERKVKISDENLILEIPVTDDGILHSNLVVNESKQIAFDISVGHTEVLKIECPEKRIGVPQRAER
jgi:hypothetical protein